MTDYDQLKESILLMNVMQTSVIAHMTFCKILELVNTLKLGGMNEPSNLATCLPTALKL